MLGKKPPQKPMDGDGPLRAGRSSSRASKSVLIVEPERDMAASLAQYLAKSGFAPLTCGDLTIGLEQAAKVNPSLVILDLATVRPSGLAAAAAWCERYRATRELAHTPLIVIGEATNDAYVTGLLGAGADDYVVRPIRPRILVARMHALLRRVPLREDEVNTKLRVGDVEVDLETYTTKVAGTEVILTLAEFRLLAGMMARPGWVFSRRQLIEQITDGEATIVGRNADVHVLALRQKLGAGAKLIVTVRGIGYKVEAPPAAPRPS